jgi:FkbM family methyltransferase
MVVRKQQRAHSSAGVPPPARALLVVLTHVLTAAAAAPSAPSAAAAPPPGRLSKAVGEHHWMKSMRHGTFLYNLRDTYIGQSLHHYGEWSEYEAQLFAQLLRPGDFVLDVGANVGGFTVPFARMVGARGAVWAFEPQRHLFQLLTANVALNEASLSVHTHHVALGADAAPGATVDVPLVNYSIDANFGGVSLLERYGASSAVPLRTLDSFFPAGARCPTFVKVDVEGMEVHVIRGAAATLRACHPVLYVENNCKKDSPGIIGALAALGYALYWDLQPYFNPRNFFNSSVDIFTNAFMSYNVLAVPEGSKYVLSRFTRIEPERPFVHQYDLSKILPHYKTDRPIVQNGDMESCTR